MRALSHAASAAGGPGCPFDDQLGPFEQLAGDVLTGLGLLAEFLVPGGEAVDPAFDRVLVPSFDAGPTNRPVHRSL